jgi:hypothetical protein
MKIHIPYSSLQTHVAQLQNFQQASDVLRRTARFVVLARRLEGQMRDMKMGGDENAVDGVAVTGGEEDEKERTIAKAALSIAELGQYFIIISRHFFTHLSTSVLCVVALLDGPNITDTPETVLDSQPTHPPDGEGELEGEDPTNNNITYIPLRSVNAVAAHIPFIEDAREKVTGEMQAMVLTGLTTLVCPSPSFQIKSRL